MKTHLLSLSLLLASPAINLHATTFQWNSSGTANWGASGVWSPDGLPGADDTIGTPLQVGTMQITGNRAIQGIDFNSSTGWTIRGGLNGMATLTIGAGGLVKSGSSQLLIRDENANGFLSVITDSMTVNAGTLSFGSASSVPLTSLLVNGTTTVAVGATLNLYITSTTLSGGLQNDGTVALNAGPADTTSAITAGGLTGSGTIRTATAATVKSSVLKVDLAGAASYSGRIEDGNAATSLALEKTGMGTQTLAGASTYSGGTTVSQGTLLVANATGSGVGTGAVVVKDGGVFGGNGIVALSSGNAITVESGGVLLGGNGSQVNGVLTIANDVALQSGSAIHLALGAGGSHSTVSRTGGTWSFTSGQSVFFDSIGGGAQAGIVYSGIITGLASDPGVSGWTIANDGWTGVFSYEDGSVSVILNTVAIPEPSSFAVVLGAIGMLAVLCGRRRSMR